METEKHIVLKCESKGSNPLRCQCNKEKNTLPFADASSPNSEERASTCYRWRKRIPKDTSHSPHVLVQAVNLNHANYDTSRQSFHLLRCVICQYHVSSALQVTSRPGHLFCLYQWILALEFGTANRRVHDSQPCIHIV